MASPQVKGGYTPIANEVMEALARADLSGRELRIVLVVIRNTWGWQKKQSRIGLGQIARALGIRRKHVHEVVKDLASRGYLKRADDGLSKKNRAATLSFNKNWEEWDGGIHSLSTSLFPVPLHRDSPVPPGGDSPVPPQGDRPVPLQGDTIKKERKERKERKGAGPPFSKKKASPTAQKPRSYHGVMSVGDVIKSRYGGRP